MTSFKNPILFIHGFAGGKSDYQPIITYLKSRGALTWYEFIYTRNIGQVSLRVIAEQLHDFITQNVIEKEIDMIALSQGGVVARYYIKHFDDVNVGRCVTLCTPHRGSLLANIGILPGIKDLQPESALLAELDIQKTEYYAVYNPLDLMVFPGWHARLDGAKQNKCVLSLTHPRTFNNSTTLAFIESVLSRK